MARSAQAAWKRFGSLVQRLRKEKGLGLRKMANLATLVIGGRGLSAPYLSAIDRGLTAPPRPQVLAVLAGLLEVPVEKLRLAAEGYVVLDIAETLKPFPEYTELVRDVQQRRASTEAIFQAMKDAIGRFPAKMTEKHVQMSVKDGTTRFLFFYRPART